MKKNSILFIGLALAVLAVCLAGTVVAATFETPNENSTVLNPDLTVSVEKTVAEIAIGDQVKFIMPSNPATGYTWVVTNAEGLNVTEDFLASDSELIGAGGKQVFILSADKAGIYTFTAEYKRPWETEAAPAATFTQIIVVRDDGQNTVKEPVFVVSFDGTMNPQVNHVVKITVPGNPTTGYEWHVTAVDGLTILKSGYIPDEHEEGMTGVGGTYVWYVTADNAGMYTFGAEYTRSWETDAAGQFAISLIFCE